MFSHVIKRNIFSVLALGKKFSDKEAKNNFLFLHLYFLMLIAVISQILIFFNHKKI